MIELIWARTISRLSVTLQKTVDDLTLVNICVTFINSVGIPLITNRIKYVFLAQISQHIGSANGWIKTVLNFTKQTKTKYSIYPAIQLFDMFWTIFKFQTVLNIFHVLISIVAFYMVHHSHMDTSILAINGYSLILLHIHTIVRGEFSCIKYVHIQRKFIHIYINRYHKLKDNVHMYRFHLLLMFRYIIKTL